MCTAVYPEYTEFNIYKELVSLAEGAGIKVQYREKEEYVIGSSSPDEFIHVVSMMVEHDYGTVEFAAFVLAHEIAHSLLKDFYSGEANHLYTDRTHIHQFMEADADKIGAALYTLAEMTAVYKANSIWR